MDEEYEDMTMDDDSTDIEEDIETQLLHLNDYDNSTQLKLLRKEIDHIIVHNLEPSEGWYDERFKHIYEYSNLGWRNLRLMFHNRDEYIYNTASYIIDGLTDLIESRCTKPNFNIQIYHKLIHDIDNIWLYYKNVYIVEEDADVSQLISGIQNLGN